MDKQDLITIIIVLTVLIGGYFMIPSHEVEFMIDDIELGTAWSR